MRYFFVLFLFVFSTISFFSCKDDEDGVLTLSVNQLQFMAEGSSEVLNIVTGHDWYIESAIDWLSFVPTSGSGNSAITVVANINEEDEDRNSTFYIKAGPLSRSVKVSQKGTYLTTDSTTLLFDREGTPKEVNITTRYSWTVDASDAQWCEIEPMEGTGEATLILTPVPITERYPRHNKKIKINCNGSEYYIIVSQDVENSAPTVPELLSPKHEAELESIYPFFSWTEAYDPDGDEVYYQILYATEADYQLSVWRELLSSPISETEYLQNQRFFQENTKYYWKVMALDNYWGGEVYSDIFSFTTDENIIYEDNQILHVQTACCDPAPNVVILGDGFIREDFGKGSTFELMADYAIESFFSIEPTKSYKDYFNVYKIVTYSEERGATVAEDFEYYDVKAQRKNTAFNSNFVGGNKTGVMCDTALVFNYVTDLLGLSKEAGGSLDNTTILLIINLEVYAGTTQLTKTGRSISMCPVERETFRELIHHEGIGHGFGRLMDEYINYPSLPISEQRINFVREIRNYKSIDDEDGGEWWFGGNISFTDDPQHVHWKHYLVHEEYNVSFYEGGYEYGLGVWCPEEYSCMKNNLPYFNAPSREAMVRRIMHIIGEDFDQKDFECKDVIKNYTPVTTLSARTAQKKRAPLAPPILVP